MRNKWIRKVISLCVMLVMTTLLVPAIPALAAPVTTISLSGTPGDNFWYLSPVTVTLTATDNISGVERIEYSFDNWNTTYTYSSPFVISNEGIVVVRARAWDNEGHMGAQELKEVKIDWTMPYSTIWKSGGTPGNNGWYVDDVTVTLSAADNVSGVSVDPIQYSLNGGGWLNYDGVPLNISNEGITTILARVRDNAGILESPPASGEVKIDKTAPVVTETVNPTQISSKKSGTMFDINYTGTASDPVSGISVKNTQLIDEYGVYSQNLGANLSGTVSVERHCNSDDSNGRTYTFRLTVTDMAGNQATIDVVTTVFTH